MADLRPQKKSLGIFIAYPAATYDELLNKYVKSPAEEESEAPKKKGGGLFGGLKNLFARKKAPAKTDEAPAPAVEPATVEAAAPVEHEVIAPVEEVHTAAVSPAPADETAADLALENIESLFDEEPAAITDDLTLQPEPETQPMHEPEAYSEPESAAGFDTEPDTEAEPEVFSEPELSDELDLQPAQEQESEAKIVGASADSDASAVSPFEAAAEEPASVPEIELQVAEEEPAPAEESWPADEYAPAPPQAEEPAAVELSVQAAVEDAEPTFSEIVENLAENAIESAPEEIPPAPIFEEPAASAREEFRPTFDVDSEIQLSSPVSPEDIELPPPAEDVTAETPVFEPGETEATAEAEAPAEITPEVFSPPAAEEDPYGVWKDDAKTEVPVALTTAASPTQIVELDEIEDIPESRTIDELQRSAIEEIDSMAAADNPAAASSGYEEDDLARAALQALEAMPEVSAASSGGEQIVVTEPPPAYQAPPPPSMNGAAVDYEFFDHAMTELSALNSTGDDVRIVPPIDVMQAEETQLLFNLAVKSLEDGGIDNGYVEKLISSDEREIASDLLSGILKSTEATIERKAVSLHPGDSKIERLRRSLHKEEPSVDLFGARNKRPAKAPASKRFQCFCIDAAASVVIGVFAALFISFCFAPELKDKVVRFADQELYESLPLFALMIVSILFAFVTYPILAFHLFKQTLGAYFSGIKIVREDYRRPRLSNIAVRTLLLPLSIACLGFLPYFFGRRTLHDWLSRTIVVI